MAAGGPTSDDEIAVAIRGLALARAPASMCPSDVARALAEDWRPLMPDVRRVAAGMPDIVATQRGASCDALTARGPIRLGLRDG